MMRFFHRDNPEQRAAVDEQRERDARSQEMIEAGGLPLRAQERLARQAATRDHPALWTSDLSVSEFLAARTLRFDALGQVLGACVYHVAYNVLQSQQYQNGDLTTFSQAMYEARDRALNRMRQEAAALGAHGVVGVRLEQKAYEWGTNLLDFSAIGTAVRLPSAALPPQPFLSDLSGQDALLLLRAGYVPVGLALGCCAYYVVTSWDDEWQMHGWGSWSNNEMRRFTQGVYQARHTAMQRMAVDAGRMGAEGIVGSDVHMRVHEVGVSRANPYRNNEYERIEDHVVEFVAVGTAIAEIGGGHQPADVDLVLDIGKGDTT